MNAGQLRLDRSVGICCDNVNMDMICKCIDFFVHPFNQLPINGQGAIVVKYHIFDVLEDELNGLELTMKATRENMAFYDGRLGKSTENASQLRARREVLEQAATRMHQKIKSTTLDGKASMQLKENLADDLAEIERQKETVTQRLWDIQTGLGEITDNKKRRLPHIRGYDSALKRIRSAFVETQNKMDVALLMKRK
jgi:chromosome segregation ATPase